MNDATHKIDAYLNAQEGWKKAKLQAFRELVHELNPDIVEEWRWSAPIFSYGGKMRLSMGSFKDHVKYNFFIKNVEGYEDPHKLFNNGFDGVTFRAIDLKENDMLDPKQLRELVAQFVG